MFPCPGAPIYVTSPTGLNTTRAKLFAVSLFSAAILLCGAGEARARGDSGGDDPPEIAAGAWALADARSGEYLAGEDASERLPIASMAKVMVALVTLENADLDEVATVSGDAASFAVPLYSNVGLYAGDTLTVRELLMAAMISSGDDATYALAEHVGGGDGKGGVDAFVAMMNREAALRGLSDTRFENPIGLDARGQYSSARDLLAMTRAASEYPEFREMVGTKRAEITTQDRVIPMTNTNELLQAYGPATGVKTGTTPAAGECLLSSAASGDESYVAVVLDARGDRFSSSIEILEHGFAAHDRRDLVVEERRYARAEVPFRRGESIELIAAESVEGLVEVGSEVEREVDVMAEPPPLARPGTRLGEVVVKVDGERVGESPLVARKGYEKASLGERVWYTVGGLFD